MTSYGKTDTLIKTFVQDNFRTIEKKKGRYLLIDVFKLSTLTKKQKAIEMDSVQR